MVNIGDTCTITQFGAALWVAMHQEPDGRWRLTGKRIDEIGRARFTSRTAGLGDIQVIAPAPRFAVGATVKHDGLNAVVLADSGDWVTLSVPENSSPLKRGGNLRIAGGNVVEVAKSDLALALM